MKNPVILWVDDEIELLKPHIMFLGSKGYDVEICNNGYDAVDMAKNTHFDLIILDEMMPGITGLETLPRLKEVSPTTPIVMVTKSEEENIMDRAIGSKIADYLIKPVNPNQVLLSIKKNIHQKELVKTQTTADYRSEFGQISSMASSAHTFEDWKAVYRKIAQWDMELSHSDDRSISEVFSYQKTEANVEFAKFIRKQYLKWFGSNPSTDKPILSQDLMVTKVFPVVDLNEKTTLLLIDNFSYYQWLTIRDLVGEFYDISEEDFYCSILPTVTQYARNALFAGLSPMNIEKHMPDKWVSDHKAEPKNQHEEEFLRRLIKVKNKNYKLCFEKVAMPEAGKKLLEEMDRVYNADFSVIVYNFLDILSHARTETEIMREFSENTFRSLTRSWFEHSELYEIIKRTAQKGHKLIITSDHGTTLVDNPIKVIGDRETSTNLRYKMGRNLSYNAKDVFEITKPAEAELPKSTISSTYIFAMKRDFLVYPNNYNHYARYYKNTYQHGGISMEEMIVPFIVLSPKN